MPQFCIPWPAHPPPSTVLFRGTAIIPDKFVIMHATQGMEKPVSYLVRLCLFTFLESLPEVAREPFVKLALTVLFSVNVKEHVAVPVQLPDHPENIQPFPGLGVNVITV